MKQSQIENVLVIGDIHEPFSLDEYLPFCKSVYKKYKCNRVVFIGDAIDGHAVSYHETDVNGLSATEELDQAIKRLAKWHKMFPNADFITGNHDALIERKLNTAGLPKKWMRPLKEVLDLPTWNFHTKLELNGVLYIHGQGPTARTAALRVGKSTVQGHRHTEGYVWFNRTDQFGMQVGTGIDKESYAFAYARHFPDPVLSCGVVLNNGSLPLFIPMR